MIDEISAAVEIWPIAGAFTIARGRKTEARVVTVRVNAAGHQGRGEAVPYARYGESVEGVLAQIAGVAERRAALDRAALQGMLPPGAARNALDCALWDLAAKQAGEPVWRLAGLPAPRPCLTAYTITLDSPETMAEAAAHVAHRPLLKIKLGGGEEDPARIRAVRAAAPRAHLTVDANEGWSLDQLSAFAPILRECGVELIEQPIPAAHDAALSDFTSPVPLCADESCHDTASLPALRGRYSCVNIKLDKTGGLTEALRLCAAARAQGFHIMLGCMVATSLAMAPAMLLAAAADFVDLDGPLMLARDRDGGLRYDPDGIVHPPAPDLWG
jgi:L-alanine-DL-glutamate epimerase-like enolase superfamily enzyme